MPFQQQTDVPLRGSLPSCLANLTNMCFGPDIMGHFHAVLFVKTYYYTLWQIWAGKALQVSKSEGEHYKNMRNVFEKLCSSCLCLCTQSSPSRLCSLCSASCQDDSLQYHARRKHTFRQTLHANGFNVFSQLMIFNLRWKIPSSRPMALNSPV